MSQLSSTLPLLSMRLFKRLSAPSSAPAPRRPSRRSAARAGCVVVPLLVAASAATAADLASLLGDKTEFSLGAAVQAGPRAEGARRSVARVLPVFSVQRGVLFADFSRGAGLQYQSDSGFYASQSFAYDVGRLDRDSDWRPGDRRLHGMGRVRPSATSRTLLMQELGRGLQASVEAEVALREGAGRSRFRTGLSYELLNAGREHVTMDLDAHWGDRRYNQAYFGVTPAQAASSALAAFRAGGGLYASSAAVTWEHRLDSHWTTSVELRGTRYLDNAAHSPVVARRDAVAATVATTYSF